MNGELLVVDDVPVAFAERVIEAFRTRPNDGFTLALSGGPLARRCYETLADLSDGAIDWWKVDVYWADERAVPLDHPDSNYRLVREALLERVGAVNMVHPMECDRGADPYHLLVGEISEFDVVHLGVGPDGHTASLFADSPGLDADPGRLVVMNHDPSGVNTYERMTFTYSAIARSRLTLVTVSGDDVSEAMAAVHRGDDVPATRIAAPHLVWLADRPAVSRIPDLTR